MTRRGILLLILLLGVLFSSSVGLAKEGTGKSEWRVRYKLTNERHEVGTPLLLRLDNGFIQAFDGKKQVLNIPVSEVLAISSDDDFHRPVHEWLMSTVSEASKTTLRQALAASAQPDLLGLKGLSGMVCAGSGAVFCHYKDTNFMATLSSGIIMAGVAALIDSHHKYRCLDLVWKEDGVLRNALFHAANDKEELHLLDALTAATGKAWLNMAEQRQQLRNEIERYKASAQPLILDRPVLLGAERLAVGEYRLVPLPREGRVELDFFRGNIVAPESFVAQAMAHVTTRIQGDTAAPATLVRYSQSESSSAIAEITTKDLVFLLSNPSATSSDGSESSLPTPSEAPAAVASAVTPAALAPASTTEKSAQGAVLPVLTLSLKDGRTAQVTVVTYHGQRAFRFPVEHFHRKFGGSMEECAGSLYIMADRIAFDAGLNMRGDRDPFEVSRSEVKEMRIVPPSLTSWGFMKVRTEKKKFDFMPYFSNTQSPIAHMPGPGSGVAGAISILSGGRQLRQVSIAGRPMLDTFMDVVLDFTGALAQVESGNYTPKPHKAEPESADTTEEPPPMQ